MGRLGAAIAFLAGCSFPHGSLMSSSPDAAPDSGPTCADVVCDPNASCATAGAEPSCTCNMGYSGDGLACAAIDPCATNNGGCPAVCEMTGPGTSTCYAPATCADVMAHTTLANDSSVTLYVNQDPAKPWTAFCHNGLEYLTLTTPDSNFGQYTASTKSPGTSVRTAYTRVRLDPTNLKVDISDQTFSTSTGMLKHDPAYNGDLFVTSMPLGVAMDCIPGGSAATGVAKVTLTGTPFTVTSGWTKGGNSALGSANSSNGGRVVSITGGGNCGWNAPTGAPSNPFNTFANAKLLVLAYAP